MTAPTPLDYAAWRRSLLGRTTEAVERAAVMELCDDVAGARVLDVGCGDGAYAVALALRGARTTGVDVSRRALSRGGANARAAGTDVAFAAGDAAALPFADASFELVVSVTALCFVASPSAALREMARVLRPGGRLVLGELGAVSLWGASRRVRGWLGVRPWRDAHLWTEASLAEVVAGAGLEPGGARGAAYHPPLGLAAAALRPLDPWLGRMTRKGAAFIALEATKPAGHA